MSARLHRINNGEQNIELLDSVQRANVERMGSSSGHMRKECNQSNEHEQSGKPCESVKCDCDPGTNATCTCTRATTGTTTDRSATTRHTSFPCAHCRDNDSTTSGLVRKHKYTSITANRECNTANDYIERDYADYVAATSAKGQGDSARVRGSDEPRNFKQADADTADSVERRIGIPAGVTI